VNEAKRERRFSFKLPKPEKTCAIVRFGGFGDLMQVSSLLPWLKSEGYHITLYTVPKSWEVVKHDPHIDRAILQGADDIPNHELGAFFEYTSKRYTKFINLCESVENTLLAMPGSSSHAWPHSMRHKHLNKNYLEFIHDIAEVPFPPRVKFYPTKEEREWAVAEHRKMRGTAIMLVLSGSAVHKTWPYIDRIIDQLLTEDPRRTIILVGDEASRMLGAPWADTPQVHNRAGEWSIRETIAFAQVCDLVIGPETGVMNAISHDKTPKIITLSHSSVNNLTRDWVNCTSLAPKNTSCWPCHQMHYGFKHCREFEKTGISACQEDISPVVMMDAIASRLVKIERIAA